MPELCRFWGIVIVMYFRDHLPPHFHAAYGKGDKRGRGGFEAQININTTEVMEGSLPRPQLALVLAWATINQAALLRAWNLAVQGKNPGKIPPLTFKKEKKKGKGKKK